MEEIWIPAIYIGFDGVIFDFSDNYEVSNLGSVRSVDRTITYSDGRRYFYKSQPIKPFINNSDYYVIRLQINNKNKTCLVSRLVLSSFNKDGYFKDAEVNHIDSCKLNNVLTNLEWVTKEENLNTEHHSKLQKSNQKHQIILQLDLNRIFLREWNGCREIERELGFLHNNISRCCKGKLKTAYGYIWEYK